jgi:protein TonB
LPSPNGFEIETREGTIRIINVDSVEFIPSGSQNTIAEKGTAPIPKGKEDVPRPCFFEDPPVPLEMPRPEYPAEAKKSRIQGRAFVQVLVDLDGSVMQTRISKSSGNAALDSAAVRGAQKFRFKPAKMDRKPVRVWVAIPVDFRLKD